MGRRRRVDLNKLPSNSQRPKRKVGKKPTAITSGKIRTKKASGGFAKEVRNIGNSLFEEIVVPAIKSAIVDFFSNGVNMAMFGSGSNTRRRDGRRPYNRMYSGNSRRASPRRRGSRRAPERTEDVMEDIFFDDREDAKLVLGRMMELIGDYGVATIGDLYSLVGMASNYTHERWGWENINDSRVHYTSEGYLVDFPEPEYFN